jgi:N-acyl-D-amino-acid deacylase
LNGDKLAEMQDYLSGLYGPTPPEWGGSSIERFLDSLKGKLPVNWVSQVPHGAIRLAAMGWEERPAKEEEIQTMLRLTEAWLDAGAVAFNTGLDYEPQAHATTEELVRLAKAAAKRGRLYAAHQRGYADKIAQGLAETFDIARQAGIPVHISHMRVDAFTETLLDRADREGVDYTFDMYPYKAGSTLLLYRLPKWAKAGPPDRLRELLKQPEVCATFIAEMKQNYGNYQHVQLSCLDCEKYGHLQGKSVLEASRLTGLDPEELIFELLRETDLRAMAIYHWPLELHPEMHRTYRHPKHMVGSDGFLLDGHPHPRGYGTFPAVLETLVRKERCISLETAVYKMSGFPAQRFGIADRGRIQPGCYADLLVFDPETIRAGADFQHPTRPPSGMEQVMVNGQFAMKDGKVVGRLPGRVL